jgi:glycosyltransferase involved in cell wall biosynthesis
MECIPFLTSDRELPAPEPRPQLSAESKLRISYLGRMVAHKRPDYLVHHWKDILALPFVAPARLDLYGDDPRFTLRQELQKHVEEHDLAETIEVHGAYSNSDLPRILENTDLVLLPSLVEGLPIVLVEAMQAGVPVVTTDAGGSAEFGRSNPDVIVTSTEWGEFASAISEMARRLRAGEIDSQRLYEWTKERYGHDAVWHKWRTLLLDTSPSGFAI